MEAGKDYDVVLGGHGFVIESGSIVRSDVSAAIPRVSVATEDKRRSDLSEMDTKGQYTWHHGRGQYVMADAAAYMDAEYCDTRIQGQVIRSPRRWSSGSFAGHIVSMHFWDLTNLLYAVVRGTVPGNNELYYYNTATDTWTVVAGAAALIKGLAGVPNNITSVAVPLGPRTVTNYLVISRVDATGVLAVPYMYSVDGAAWVAAGVGNSEASVFAQFQERLVFDYSNSAIALRPDPPGIGADILITNLGTANERINNIITFGEMLVVFKESRAFSITLNIDGTTYSTREIIDYSWARAETNGTAAIVWQGSLYFNVGDSVYQYNGTTMRSVGPDLGAHQDAIDRSGSGATDFDGRPAVPYAPAASKRGGLTGFAQQANWIYGVVNGATQGVVMAYGGTGWHELTLLRNSGAGRCWFFPPMPDFTEPTLWFRDGSELTYIKLPVGTDNRYDYSAVDYEQTGTSVMYSSWYDLDLEEIRKDFTELHMSLDVAVPGTDSVIVEYQLESDTAITYYLGTLFLSGVLRFEAEQQYQQVVQAKSIRLKFTLVGSVRIRNFFFECIARPESRFGWRFLVKAEDNLDLTDGTMSRDTSQEIAQNLYKLRRQGGALRFDDGRTESGLINILRNANFDGWTSSVIPQQWAVTGSASMQRSAQYKKHGAFSLALTATGVNGGCVYGAAIAIPTTTGFVATDGYHIVLHLFATTMTSLRVRMPRDRGGVVTDQVNQVLTLAALPTEDDVLDVAFQRHVINVPGVTGLWQGGDIYQGIYLTAPGGTGLVYIDSIEIRPGQDDESPLVAPGEPRCRPLQGYGASLFPPHRRLPYWLVYMTAMGESFFSPMEELNSSVREVVHDTRFNVEVREVS